MAKTVDETKGGTEGGSLVSKDKFLKHFRSMAKLQSDVAELRGDLATLHKDGDDINIHRQAAKMAAKLKKMDDAKRDEYLHHLLLYCEYLDIPIQGNDMFRKNGEADPKAPNVTAFAAKGAASH